MDLTEINQKIDKVLEYQEKQAKYAKIKFWVMLVLIVVFFILPLVLLPFAINQFLDVYGVSMENAQNNSGQFSALLNLFQ